MGKLIACFSLGIVGEPILQSGLFSRSLHALKRVRDIPTLCFRVLEGIIILQSLRYIKPLVSLFYGSNIKIIE
jgi:hypothetical protein